MQIKTLYDFGDVFYMPSGKLVLPEDYVRIIDGVEYVPNKRPPPNTPHATKLTVTEITADVSVGEKPVIHYHMKQDEEGWDYGMDEEDLKAPEYFRTEAEALAEAKRRLDAGEDL